MPYRGFLKKILHYPKDCCLRQDNKTKEVAGAENLLLLKQKTISAISRPPLHTSFHLPRLFLYNKYYWETQIISCHLRLPAYYLWATVQNGRQPVDARCKLLCLQERTHFLHYPY